MLDAVASVSLTIQLSVRFAGGLTAVISPDTFIADQISGSNPVIHDNARAVALQLGNMYLLLGMIYLAVLYTTTEPAVVRNFLWVLWAADASHIMFTVYILGYERLLNVAQWNAMTWGSVALTVRML